MSLFEGYRAFYELLNILTYSQSLILTDNKLKFEPAHDKTNKMACAPSEDSDQSGHQGSSLCNQWVAKDPSFLYADSEDSDMLCTPPCCNPEESF